MAIKRGEDGNIIESKTEIAGGDTANATRRVNKKMPPLPSKSKQPSVGSEKETPNDKTQLVGRKKTSNTEAELKKNVRTIGEDQTRLVRSGANSLSSDDASDTKVINQVVGWLVVLDGPGKGASREIGYGNNPIGRSSDAVIGLDFGDTSISREKHCVLSYDPKSRNFFMSPGDSRNLVYLNDAPVLAPSILSSGDEIGLGETLLSFVPFCGPDFDWSDKD